MLSRIYEDYQPWQLAYDDDNNYLGQIVCDDPAIKDHHSGSINMIGETDAHRFCTYLNKLEQSRRHTALALSDCAVEHSGFYFDQCDRVQRMGERESDTQELLKDKIIAMRQMKSEYEDTYHQLVISKMQISLFLKRRAAITLTIRNGEIILINISRKSMLGKNDSRTHTCSLMSDSTRKRFDTLLNMRGWLDNTHIISIDCEIRTLIWLPDGSLQFNEYQRKATTTAIYPDAGKKTKAALSYLSLGLAGEAGEFANKIKKLLRGDKEMNETIKADLIHEAGDVMWYLSQIANELDVKFSELASLNLWKLHCRNTSNKIKGDGDHR